MSRDPLSYVSGFDRGVPVDRKFIEDFLSRHSAAIKGHCLEVKDDTYVRRFGDHKVVRCDVLDIDASNPRATIVADLQDMAGVHDDTFDCAVVTQTLQFLRDPRKGIEQLHRVLKVGGTLLLTVPSLAKAEPCITDYWRFMPDGAMALFDIDRESSALRRRGILAAAASATTVLAAWPRLLVGNVLEG